MKALATAITDIIKGKPRARRSSKWFTTRKNHLKQYPYCAVCRGTKKLEVHHIVPFHINPELENNPNNLITLCEGSSAVNCHLFFGHLGNYKKYNNTVIVDAALWREKLK